MIDNLSKQAEGKPVEVLWLGDNYQRTVGAKRNALIDLSQGEYFAFVDDDDIVVEDYVDTILTGIADSTSTVFCFGAYRHHNGRKDREVKYGCEFKQDRNSVDAYYRLPNHLMCWKKEAIKSIRFEELNYGEDSAWAVKLYNSGLIKKQTRTKKVLYHYYFNENSTETQQW